ncbi:Basic-leucine zipper (bZIP) transcription factor family protein [Actinidia rufa]|uniref:Basic-leucine zipper (BZIP) transcription factor family protein n=1 Tax=Actinidia rufa TaxID=165716 RepID=A0A7J0F7Z6_9ERIC|nr:Basic-leucine zipper (bZIP) transcription factor family protein [Actinidia rufa]
MMTLTYQPSPTRCGHFHKSAFTRGRHPQANLRRNLPVKTADDSEPLETDTTFPNWCTNRIPIHEMVFELFPNVATSSAPSLPEIHLKRLCHPIPHIFWLIGGPQGQFAQRSRVRKLQYIAELERNVQALQAKGSEVSAELEFVNQQNLILNMENKALKQRLESLAQEQLIKYMEHEVLEREIGRLRALYQQHQQQPPPPSSTHRRANSRDLDS